MDGSGMRRAKISDKTNDIKITGCIQGILAEAWRIGLGAGD